MPYRTPDGRALLTGLQCTLGFARYAMSAANAGFFENVPSRS